MIPSPTTVTLALASVYIIYRIGRSRGEKQLSEDLAKPITGFWLRVESFEEREHVILVSVKRTPKRLWWESHTICYQVAKWNIGRGRKIKRPKKVIFFYKKSKYGFPELNCELE